MSSRLTLQTRLRVVALVLSCALAFVFTFAQEHTPQLSEVQRLQLQNLSQSLELAQLRAQIAQRDFDAAREAITKLVQSLQRPGYTLDLSTMSYVKQPEKPAEKETP